MVHHVAKRVKNYFYSDSKCTGCGICEKVCPSQKITMEGNKPLWQRNVDCYMCYACLNFCPTEAIQIYLKIYMKSYTPERGRYPHPENKKRKQGDGSLFDNPRLPLAKQTFIGMMIMPGKQ